MVACIHLCRGNSVGQWAAEGGYEPVAEVLLNQVDVDAYFSNTTMKRSGDFARCVCFPRHSRKRIVLGLVSTKLPALESKDALKRRIGKQRQNSCRWRILCLSPQCGFAEHISREPDLGGGAAEQTGASVEVATEVWWQRAMRHFRKCIKVQ